jgi:hypothetical protein
VVPSEWELQCSSHSDGTTSVCKQEAQIQLRFLMMSDITLEICCTIDISGIINSVTELHLVGDLLLV